MAGPEIAELYIYIYIVSCRFLAENIKLDRGVFQHAMSDIRCVLIKEPSTRTDSQQHSFLWPWTCLAHALPRTSVECDGWFRLNQFIRLFPQFAYTSENIWQVHNSLTNQWYTMIRSDFHCIRTSFMSQGFSTMPSFQNFHELPPFPICATIHRNDPSVRPRP